MKKIIHVRFKLFYFVLGLLLLGISQTQAAATLSCPMIETTLPWPLALQQSFSNALCYRADGVLPGETAKLILTSLDILAEENWAIATVVMRPQNLPETYQSLLLYESALAIGYKLNGNWEISIEGESSFNQLVQLAPTSVLNKAFQDFLTGKEPAEHEVQQAMTIKWPWTAGQTWSYSQGIHSVNNSAVDFAPFSSIPANDRKVLAATTGAVYRRCDDAIQSDIVLIHTGNNATGYLHLERNSTSHLVAGATVYQGGLLGITYNAASNSACGFGSGPHLHFHIGVISGSSYILQPIAGTVFSGWTLQSNSCFTQSGQPNKCPGVPITSDNNPNQAPQLPIHNSPANNSWTNSPYLQWTPGADDGIPNPAPDFWVQVDNNSDFSSPEVNTEWGYLSTQLFASLAVDQTYYWRVNQGDGELSSGWTTPWMFRLDRALPFVNCNLTGPGSGNGWYTGPVSVVCSAHDNTGNNNSGIASTSYLLDGVPQAASFQVTGEGPHTVAYSATDQAGNTASGSKSAGIDITPPTTSMMINNGASVTHSANVLLHNTSADNLSGLWRMCASLDQVNWTCAAHQSAMAFSLPNNNQTTHTVYFRVEDRAGNLSTVASDSIYLDLYPAMPSSSSYQLCQGTIAAAAGVSSSSSYQLVTTLGVPGGNAASSSYQLTTGVGQGCLSASGSTYLPLVIRP